MRLTSLILLATLALGCSSDDSTNVPADSASSVASQPNPGRENSSQQTETDPIKSSYTLHDLDSIIPRPIKSESDAQICLEAANKMPEKIKRLTGLDYTSRTQRLADCVVQYDTDDSYSKYFPDGKRIRLNFRSTNIADVNIFAPGAERPIAHFRFDETTIWISGSPNTNSVQLMLWRPDKTKPFSQFGDWSQTNQPDRLEKYVLDLYNDFAATRN